MFKPALIIAALFAFTIDEARAATDYERISMLPCTTYLASYGNRKGTYFDDIITFYMAKKVEGMNGPNMSDAVACECRLHETETISTVVATIIATNQRGLNMRVPVGGTASRKEVTYIEAFSKWIRHEGPRPRSACDYF